MSLPLTDPSPGKRIGRFEIQAELGRGGFGRVYRGYDPVVGRLVAVKILTAQGADLLTRFRNEAAAAGNLHHRNIVTIYEFGDHEGLPYIAMEFLEGEDLNQAIANRKPLTVLDKISIMLQVADGLACAHRNGVVHRDVKPANIRLLGDGTVKIMDFGIARLTGAGAGPRLTQHGDLIGTLLYMSPEQIMGGDVDALSDIFAFGVTFYELLTGRHPFQAADPRAVLFKITSQDPESIRKYAPECPEALEHVITRALQRDRELRYQNLKELEFDAEPILIELQQERAAALLADAQKSFAEENLEQTQALLLQVLELDPPNRTARELRAAVETRMRKRVLQPKIEALTTKGEASLAGRRFAEACENFEAALRLDPANTSLKARLDEARGFLERGRAAAKLVLEARQLLKQEPAAALVKVTEAAQLDPESEEARRLKETIIRESEARQRERQLQAAVGRATELLAHGQFGEAEAALSSLDAASLETPAVADVIRSIQAQRAEAERRARLRGELAGIGRAVQASRFEESLARLRALQDEFPDETEVSALLERAQAGLQAQRREEAIAKAAAEADAALSRGDFPAALRFLSTALRDFPGEKRLLALERQATEAGVSETRTQAEQLLRERRPAQAVERIRSAIDTYSAGDSLSDILALALKAQAVAAAVSEAQTRQAAGDLSQAVRGLRGALQQFPGDPELVKLEAEIAIASAVAEAEALNRESRHDDALSAIAAAQEKHGARPAFSELAGRIRVQAAQAAAQLAESLVTAGRFQEAVAALKSAVSRYGAQVPLTEALARAEQMLRSQHARKDALARAEELFARGQYNDVLAVLDAAAAEFGGDRDVAALAERTRKLLTEQQQERERGIEQALSEAESLRRSTKFEEALQVIARAQAHYGKVPVLDALADRVSKERSIALETALAQVRTLFEARKYRDALTAADAALERHASAPGLHTLRTEAAAALEAETARAEAVASARRLFEARRYDEALAAAETALKKWPEESALISVRDQVTAVRHAREEARLRAEALLDDGQFQRALQLLEDVQRRYGEDASLAAVARQIAAAAAEAKERAKVEQAQTAIHALIEGRRFDEALTAAEEALRAWPSQEGLRSQRDEIRKALAARREAHGRAEALSARGEFDAALSAIGTAQARYGEDGSLASLAQRITEAREASRRAEAVTAMLAEASSLLERAQFDQAVSLLESAKTRYPGHAELARQLAHARTERAAAQVSELIRRREIEKASAILEPALRDDPGASRLVALTQQIAAALAARKEALSRAEALRRNGAFGQALAAIAKARQEHGADAGLTALEAHIQAEWEAFKRSESLRALVAEARSLAEKGEYDEAIGHLEGSPYAGEADVVTELARIRRLRVIAEARGQLQSGELDRARETVVTALRTYPKEPALKELQREIRRAPSPAKPRRSPLKAVVVGLLGVAAVVGGITVYRLKVGAGTVPVEVRTSADGAIVRVQGQTCMTPDCKLELKPGSYVFEATLPGYKSAKTSMQVDRQGGPAVLELTLEPLKPALRVTTNLESGTVRLDGSRRGELIGGQFLDDLAPGHHEIEVAAKDAGVKVNFESAPGKLPTVSGTPDVRDGEAVVVTAFNGEALVACPGCKGQAAVDGKPAGELGKGSLRLQTLGPGDHELQVNGESGPHKFTFEAGARPSIMVSVNSGKNVGTLLVETGVDGATILVNGRRMRGRTARGQAAAFPLEPNNYRVRVELPGYRSEPQEIEARVNRGDQMKARFRLEPLPSRLVLTGTPGATVSIDGTRTGEISQDGKFAATVPPGDHRIEVGKEGFQRVTIARSFGPGEAVQVGGAETRLSPVVQAPKPQPPPPVKTEPPPPPRPDPDAIEAQDYQKAVSSNSVKQLEEFLARYPKGKYSEQAAAQIENQDWAATDKSNRASLQEFLRKHPAGRFSEQAKAELGKLDQLEKYRTESDAVLEILRQYEAAYNQRSMERLQSLMRGFSERAIKEMRESFKMFREVSLHLRPEQPVIDGNMAMVRCSRSLMASDNMGRPRTINDNPRFKLEKSGGRWYITEFMP